MNTKKKQVCGLDKMWIKKNRVSIIIILILSGGMFNSYLIAEDDTVNYNVPDFEITLHFHNTRGIGLANVLVGLQEGINHYESCIGGIGGCPFAPDATGNICSEDLIYLLEGLGIKTGIDLNKLIKVAKKAEKILGYTLPGQVMHAGPRLKKYSIYDVPTASGN